MPDSEKKTKLISLRDLHNLYVALQGAINREVFTDNELKVLEPLLKKLETLETIVKPKLEEVKQKENKE